MRFTYPLKARITKRKELSYCIKYEKQLDSVKIAISNTGNEARCIKYKHRQRVVMSVGDGQECENLNKGGVRKSSLGPSSALCTVSNTSNGSAG